MFRYVPQRGGLSVDPRAQTEDLTADPVEAGRLAILNLKRVVPNLADWATAEGEGFDDLEQIYGETGRMWLLYMRHAANVIGGVREDLKVAGQDGSVYTPVPRAEQERALAFLAEEALEPPTWMLEPSILRQIEHAGTLERMRQLQGYVLGALVDEERLQRLSEIEALYPEDAYPMNAFMSDVRAAVWSELEGGSRPEIGIYRRQLQREYLGELERLMTDDIEVDSRFSQYVWRTPVTVSRSDIRPAARAQLRQVRDAAARGARRAADAATRAHLDDVVARIDALFEADS
jgi:hypothetical protein